MMPSPVLKRSVVLSGHKTSISLEAVLAGTAGDRDRARDDYVGSPQSIASKRGESNLSSAVRVFVLAHFRAARQKETKA